MAHMFLHNYMYRMWKVKNRLVFIACLKIRNNLLFYYIAVKNCLIITSYFFEVLLVLFKKKKGKEKAQTWSFAIEINNRWQRQTGYKDKISTLLKKILFPFDFA